MFSLQPSDELVFGAPNPPKVYEDLIIKVKDDDAASTQTNFINFSSERRVVSPTMNSPGLTRVESHEMRRVVRKDIERKRRKEMANLHLNLASLLPIELKKGKSAVCDQMQDAANYIKIMQNKVEELRTKRDKLSENKVSSDGGCVTINLLPDGMEILIKADHLYFGVSRALEVLAEMELDVVNFVSTRTDGGFLHKIQIQARDVKSLNISMLHDKLCNAMN